MNRVIPRIGAVIVTSAVVLFAICLLIPFLFGAYFVCMLLPIGYIMMAAGLHHESRENRRVAANTGMAFAVVYAVLIFLVYFAQTTSVRLGGLSEQVLGILDFQRGGLMFNYDLLGYGMMALSTCFMGLSIQADSRADKWMKALMVIHGVFFFGCFIMPMTGVFAGMSGGKPSIGGVAALEAWCAYFRGTGIQALREENLMPAFLCGLFSHRWVSQNERARQTAAVCLALDVSRKLRPPGPRLSGVRSRERVRRGIRFSPRAPVPSAPWSAPLFPATR